MREGNAIADEEEVTPEQREKERALRNVQMELIAVGKKKKDLERMLDLCYEEEWRHITAAKELGMRQVEIAKLLGISEGRMSQIVNTPRRS